MRAKSFLKMGEVVEKSTVWVQRVCIVLPICYSFSLKREREEAG